MLQKKTIFVLVALALSLTVFVTGCLFWVTQLSRPVSGQGVSFSDPAREVSSKGEEDLAQPMSSALEEAQQVEPVSQAQEAAISQPEPELPEVVATAETPVVVQEENTVTETFTEEQLNHETSANNTGTAIQPPVSSAPASSEAAQPSQPSSSSSETVSQPETGTTQRSALDEAIQMPEYTPSGIMLYVTWKGTQYYADAVTVLSGITQAEIVGGVAGATDSRYAEAYKAQAVAAHSYVAYYNNQGTAPTVYLQVPNAQTVRYVEQVASQMVYSGGSPIMAVYCASAGGHTVGSQYVWGGTVSYLTGVESKYDEDNSTVSVTSAQLKETLLAKNSSLDLSGDPSTWLTVVSTGDDGVVHRLKIGGDGGSVTVYGNTFRESWFSSIRSPKFTFSYDAASDTFTFSARGYGHCVGMSQVGAMGYARYEGWNYVQILTHYYTGTTVS